MGQRRSRCRRAHVLLLMQIRTGDAGRERVEDDDSSAVPVRCAAHGSMHACAPPRPNLLGGEERRGQQVMHAISACSVLSCGGSLHASLLLGSVGSMREPSSLILGYFPAIDRVAVLRFSFGFYVQVVQRTWYVCLRLLHE